MTSTYISDPQALLMPPPLPGPPLLAPSDLEEAFLAPVCSWPCAASEPHGPHSAANAASESVSGVVSYVPDGLPVISRDPRITVCSPLHSLHSHVLQPREYSSTYSSHQTLPQEILSLSVDYSLNTTNHLQAGSSPALASLLLYSLHPRQWGLSCSTLSSP